MTAVEKSGHALATDCRYSSESNSDDQERRTMAARICSKVIASVAILSAYGALAQDKTWELTLAGKLSSRTR